MSEAAEAAYAVFPLTMAHPAFEPAKSIPVPGSEIRDGLGNVVRVDYRGTPEKFPPVTVSNPQEEEYYVAQGYKRAGQIDPSAWVKAHSDAPPDEYVPLKYPLWRDGVLYMTAQEDPGATEEDLRPQEAAEPSKAASEPVQPSGEAENLRAMMEEMNRTMQAMNQQMAEQKAEANRLAAKNAELESMLDQATAPAAGPAPAEAQPEEPADTPRKPKKAA